MKKIILGAFVLTTLLTGCTVYQIDSQDTTENFFPPKTSLEDVRYIERVDVPFEEIGIVTVTTERRQSLEDVIPKLKQEAAILGGDAITDIQTNSSGEWKSVQLQKLLGNAYIRSKFSARVLILK